MTVQQVEIFDFEKFAIRDKKVSQEIREGRYPINQATVISTSALEEIKYLLKEKLIEPGDFGVESISDKALKAIMDEIGTEWTTRHGNWPKRFAKVFKNQRGQKFSNDFLSQVGKIARESCVMSTGRELIVTRDFSWHPGRYGDDSSCYWGCRSGAKIILEQARAFALLIHGDDDYPLGRAWCIPYESYYVIFNSYAISGESITIVAFARILSDTFNYPYYRNVRLTCRDMNEGPLWINGGKGYIIGAQEVANIDDVDLDYPLYCDGCGDECTGGANLEDNQVFCADCCGESNICDCCDGRVNSDDTYWVHGCAVCPACFDRDAYSCYACGRNDWNDNAYEYDGEYFCEHCVERYFVTCDHCGECVHQSDSVELHNDRVYCSSCARDYTRVCVECEERFDAELEDADPDLNLCNECYGSLIFTCKTCEERFNRKTETVGQKVSLCNECYHKEYPEERPTKGKTKKAAR